MGSFPCRGGFLCKKHNIFFGIWQRFLIILAKIAKLEGANKKDQKRLLCRFLMNWKLLVFLRGK
jgi:hypothetical protein